MTYHDHKNAITPAVVAKVGRRQVFVVSELSAGHFGIIIDENGCEHKTQDSGDCVE